MLLLIMCFNLVSGNLRYDNYMVKRVTPETEQQLTALRTLQETVEGYSFWTDVSTLNRPVDILVPPKLKKHFANTTRQYKLKSKTWIPNIQKLIENERPTNHKASENSDWKQYQTLDQLNTWLDSLQEKFPNMVQLIEGGKSYEGREIRGVKVSYGQKAEGRRQSEVKKAVFIEGGINAREWISTAVVTCITNTLLTNNDSSVREVSEGRDWYLFPVVNPDGYVYTHAQNRLWRKTRKPYGNCIGADPNHNWGFNWTQNGARSKPCMEFFAGTSAFSEIETQSLAKYIDRIALSLDSYLSFRSYSQRLLLPFGHSESEVQANNAKLLNIAKNATGKLRMRHGNKYTVESYADASYVGSGGSIDWAVNAYKNIRLPLIIELPDKERYSFLLPPDQITPICEEALDLVVSIFQQADGI